MTLTASGVCPFRIGVLAFPPFSSSNRRTAQTASQHRCLIHGRAAFDLLGIHVGSTRQQQPNLRLVVNRPEQRCRTSPVPGVDIGTFVDEQRQALQGAESGCVMQRRRTRGIFLDNTIAGSAAISFSSVARSPERTAASTAASFESIGRAGASELLRFGIQVPGRLMREERRSPQMRADPLAASARRHRRRQGAGSACWRRCPRE